ncbi:MAG: helix-turn-helix transcriptional regulator [Verrucomicrobiae bacterium]|nr:helix-turn-helix transcriptional regulator [Verrucomicrobiae bacterium]MDW8344226.1 helix-turn-helix transcriptional regulator [Verrucomicrobiae bacterium]
MKTDGHLSLHERVIAPGTEWSPEESGWWFLRVSDGEGYFWQTPRPIPLSVGMTIVAAHGSRCRLRASQLTSLRLHHFRLIPEFLPGVLTPLERQQLDALARRDLATGQAWPFDHPVSQQFDALVRHAQTGESLVVRCQMLQLLGLILRDAKVPTVVPEPAAITARDRFERLILQMPEADLQNETPASLAKRCGCSVRHFSRLFREYFGHSFVPKKTELRLIKARQLLLETDAKIIDVALDSGFQHVGQFTTLFKKQFGMTPSRYRQRYRNNSSTR